MGRGDLVARPVRTLRDCFGTLPRNDNLGRGERLDGVSCQTQINALAGGARVRLVKPDVAQKVARQFKGLPYKARKTEWKAHLRMLDRTEPSYKT